MKKPLLCFFEGIQWLKWGVLVNVLYGLTSTLGRMSVRKYSL